MNDTEGTCPRPDPEFLLNAMVQQTTDVIYAKDIQGRYLFFNPAAAGLTGKSEKEALGRDDRFLFPLPEAEAIMAGDRLVMDSRKTKTYEEEVTGADGQKKIFLATKGPIFDDRGSVIGLFGIARDITDRKRQEALTAESEAWNISGRPLRK